MTENDSEEKTDIVHYYSREHRLRNASPLIREQNEKTKSRPGFLRSIAGSKGNVFILISILIICFMYFMGSRNTGKQEAAIILGGNKIAVTVHDEASVPVLVLEKTIQTKSAYTGSVDITVLPELSGEDAQVMAHRVNFTEQQKETFYVTLPFEGARFAIVLRTQNETITRTVTRTY